MNTYKIVKYEHGKDNRQTHSRMSQDSVRDFMLQKAEQHRYEKHGVQLSRDNMMLTVYENGVLTCQYTSYPEQ